MRKVLNCKTCMYTNEAVDGSVVCDRRELIEDVLVRQTAEQAVKHCVSHSSIDFEEIRMDRPWNLNSQADDVCGVCYRRLNLLDNDTYKEVEIENAEGTGKRTIKKCVICERKGR